MMSSIRPNQLSKQLSDLAAGTDRGPVGQQTAWSLGNAGKPVTEAITANSESFRNMAQDQAQFAMGKATGKIDSKAEFASWEESNLKNNGVSEQDAKAAVSRFSEELAQLSTTPSESDVKISSDQPVGQQAAWALGRANGSGDQASAARGEVNRSMLQDQAKFAMLKMTGDVSKETSFVDWEKSQLMVNGVSEQDADAAVKQFAAEQATATAFTNPLPTDGVERLREEK